MNDEVDQSDRIQLPRGWGPVLLLAAVVLLSDLALGLWVRSLLVDHSVAMAQAGSAAGGRPTSAPMGPIAGQAVPGAAVPVAAVPGVVAGVTPSAAGGTYQVDESVFTEELDAFVRSEALAAGMDPESVPTARQVYEQMERSGLLPANGDLDIHTVLSGHVREMAKHAAGGGEVPGGGAGMPGGGAGMPGGGKPGGQPPVGAGAE